MHPPTSKGDTVIATDNIRATIRFMEASFQTTPPLGALPARLEPRGPHRGGGQIPCVGGGSRLDRCSIDGRAGISGRTQTGRGGGAGGRGGGGGAAAAPGATTIP